MTDSANLEQQFPEEWPDAGDDLMSNYDHQVNKKIEAKLQKGNFVAGYPGWNFYATCWFRNGQFHARVKVYGSVRGFYSADTAKELMDIISSEYGYD